VRFDDQGARVPHTKARHKKFFSHVSHPRTTGPQ
jgi:hypothetical protein